MILTVTLNPLLERRFEFESVNYSGTNRTIHEIPAAGGKGINVSRQLNKLGIDNSAFTFAGGFSGKLFKRLLAEENIKTGYVQLHDELRNGTVVIDKSKNSVSTFLGRNSNITESEADEFLSRLEKMIPNSEMIVLCGSSPSSLTDKIFPSVIKLANDNDKITLLDTYGNHLDACLDASPTIIHNNVDELKSFLSDDSENEILNMLDHFYSKGIKQAFITNGSGPVYASNFDFHFKITTPVINQKDPTGSGDSFTAGLIYGWHNNLTFEETAIIASCLGAANASDYKTCSSSLDECEIFRNQVSVIPVGKKMKTLDVTPR
jgi:tagatose 6-phosphate kinase